MRPEERIPAPASSLMDVSSIARQWAAATLAYRQWLMTCLDVQTALWKEGERALAASMQARLEPACALPSAQPLLDAAQRPWVSDSTILQKAWTGWAQVWVNALKHDVTER